MPISTIFNANIDNLKLQNFIYTTRGWKSMLISTISAHRKQSNILARKAIVCQEGVGELFKNIWALNPLPPRTHNSLSTKTYFKCQKWYRWKTFECYGRDQLREPIVDTNNALMTRYPTKEEISSLNRTWPPSGQLLMDKKNVLLDILHPIL